MIELQSYYLRILPFFKDSGDEQVIYYYGQCRVFLASPTFLSSNDLSRTPSRVFRTCIYMDFSVTACHEILCWYDLTIYVL